MYFSIGRHRKQKWGGMIGERMVASSSVMKLAHLDDKSPKKGGGKTHPLYLYPARTIFLTTSFLAASI